MKKIYCHPTRLKVYKKVLITSKLRPFTQLLKNTPLSLPSRGDSRESPFEGGKGDVFTFQHLVLFFSRLPVKKILIVILLLTPILVSAQSKTTKSLQDKYNDAFVLFFYNNTLNMLNQGDDEDFAELIKDIDKMKFLRISKKENKITEAGISKLKNDYKSEDFEDLMTMRHEGMNVQVYIQEDDGVTTGLVFLMTDDESLSVLDVKGKVPMNQLANLISKVKNID